VKPLLPAGIFLIGTLPIPILKGKWRQAYLLFVPLLAVTNLFLLKVDTTWAYSFMGLKIILLQADKLNLFVGFIFVFIGLLTVLYSLHVEDVRHHLLSFGYIGAALGAIFAGDFFTLYVFWELMTLAAVGIILLGGTRESIAAAWRYFIMHLLGGVTLFAGIIIRFVEFNTLRLEFLGPDIASFLILFGIGVSAAFVFLHTWLPDAYPKASFAGSVFLSIYTTKTAVYLLARLFPGWDIVAFIGVAMAIFGVTLALLQCNGRKLLSYHIISQVGYMVAAIGFGIGLGVNGGIFHLFNNILFKTLLFMAIGALIYQVGSEDLSELGGVALKMPVTTTAAIIGALSISGVPLFNGFVSKIMILEVARSSSIAFLLLVLAAVGTFLSFLKFSYFGFLRPNEKMEVKAREVPVNMVLSMSVIAALCLAIGLYPQTILKFLPYQVDFEFYSFESVFAANQLVVVVGVLFFLVRPVFRAHHREMIDIDYLYIRGARAVYEIASGITWINQAVEKGGSALFSRLLRLKEPLVRSNRVLTQVLSVLFVDMWLSQPVSPSVWELVRDKAGRYTTLVSTGKEQVSKILQLTEKMALSVASLGYQLSLLTSELIEQKVINQLAHVVGGLTVRIGRLVRQIQNGQVQCYGLLMIMGLLFLIFWTFGYLNIF
jgi:multicomponent Na+:H+ antiporter subunit D